MRSEKGVTLTSIMIYIIALTITVIAVGRITVYFYKNINEINSVSNSEYMKFNSYFTEEVNTEENTVDTWDNSQSDYKYIIFKKSKNQYTWQNGKIYRGKVKICNNVENCSFQYDEDSKIITVNLTIKGHNYNTTYTIRK